MFFCAVALLCYGSLSVHLKKESPAILKKTPICYPFKAPANGCCLNSNGTVICSPVDR